MLILGLLGMFLMLRWYLAQSPHFYSDWLWPYCDSSLPQSLKFREFVKICGEQLIQKQKQKIMYSLQFRNWLLDSMNTISICIYLKTPKLTQDPHSAALSIEKQMLMPFNFIGYICSLDTVTPNIRLPKKKKKWTNE